MVNSAILPLIAKLLRLFLREKGVNSWFDEIGVVVLPNIRSVFADSFQTTVLVSSARFS